MHHRNALLGNIVLFSLFSFSHSFFSSPFSSQCRRYTKFDVLRPNLNFASSDKLDDENILEAGEFIAPQPSSLRGIVPLLSLLWVALAVGLISHDNFIFHFQYPHPTINFRYFLAGGACAALSHGLAVPVDVIKIRMQTYPATYQNGVLGTGIAIASQEGVQMLFKGIGPTIWGYCLHGSLKYGLYESLKPVLLTILCDSGWSALGVETKLLQFIASGVMAEFVASTFILPIECARIRMINNPSFASGTVDGIQKVFAMTGNFSIWQSFPTIMLKHVPFTVTQLTTFEFLTAALYRVLGSSGLSPMETVSVRVVGTSLAALLSGCAASLVSQPADTLMSRISSAVVVEGTEDVENPFSKIASGVRELGVLGLFSGTRARLLHVGVIYVIQLLAYDSIKTAFGIIPRT